MRHEYFSKVKSSENFDLETAKFSSGTCRKSHCEQTTTVRILRGCCRMGWKEGQRGPGVDHPDLKLVAQWWFGEDYGKKPPSIWNPETEQIWWADRLTSKPVSSSSRTWV